MIKLQAIGHLGRDCSIKDFNGRNAINFNVAHTEKYKDNSGVQHERTIWLECTYWSESTNIAQYLKKGQLVFVEGSPEANSYTDKDGNAKANLKLTVRSMQLLGSSSNSGNTPAPTQNQQQAPQYQQSASMPNSISNDASDDLPF